MFDQLTIVEPLLLLLKLPFSKLNQLANLMQLACHVIVVGLKKLFFFLLAMKINKSYLAPKIHFCWRNPMAIVSWLALSLVKPMVKPISVDGEITM